MSFVLRSKSIHEGGVIPDKHARLKGNVSPELSWSGAPSGTVSFALVVDDPDAPVRPFVHWVVYDIPVSTEALPEGVDLETVLPEARRGMNGMKNDEYFGPAPPLGQTHNYRFKLYAVSKLLGDLQFPTGDKLEKALEPVGVALGKALLTAKYG